MLLHLSLSHNQAQVGNPCQTKCQALPYMQHDANLELCYTISATMYINGRPLNTHFPDHLSSVAVTLLLATCFPSWYGESDTAIQGKMFQNGGTVVIPVCCPCILRLTANNMLNLWL